MLSALTPTQANEQAVNSALKATYIQTGLSKIVQQSEAYGQLLINKHLRYIGLEREVHFGLGMYKILKSREISYANWRLTTNAVYVTISL
jgi:hypothetical protein